MARTLHYLRSLNNNQLNKHIENLKIKLDITNDTVKKEMLRANLQVALYLQALNESEGNNNEL